LVEREGSQAALARKIHIAQPTIGRYIAGKGDPGIAAAELVATALGVKDVRVFLGRVEPSDESVPSIRHLPGWSEAALEARRQFRRLSDQQIEDVGDTMTRRPPSFVTAEFILKMADALEAGRASADAETAAAKAELAAERKRRGQ